MRVQISLAALLLALGVTSAQSQYFGKDLGKLSELHHGVRGRVYAVDSRTLFIKDFHYDGEGPAAFFYVGNTKAPSTEGGIRVRDERGSTGVLRKYRGKDITLTLPEGKTLTNLRWFSVYCDEYSVNFGDVKIPRNVDYPRPQKIAALSGVHGVSSDPVVIVDAQTLLVPNFSYDGEAPDAKFWVGRGEKPSPQGVRIPDENGKVLPLRRYDRKTIVLTLPGDLTVFDIGHFGVWCEAFTVDFGHVRIPQLSNVPPSLKMLGVSPQSKLNCEVLHDELAFEVRWAVAGDSIVLQLVAKLEDSEYMSFGLSGDPSRSQMVGGDVAVAWVDKETLKGYAYDYYLDAKSQCAGVRGSCPDERLGEKTNSVRLLNAAMVNGYSIVTYQRPLKAADELDRAVPTNGSQAVIWAIGPLNARNEVSYHSQFTKGDKIFEFGRPPAWNCPMPETEDQQEASSEDGDPNQGQYLTETSSDKDTGLVAINDNGAYSQNSVIRPNPVPTPKPASKVAPWVIPPIQCFEPEDGVFYAQMGPTGGKHGYPAITGHVGWGISWYINGLLIPEINVVRGRTYTFVTEGGSDPDVPAKFHPFYITDDSVGGYQHKSDKEKAAVKIFAGVRRTRSGEVIPTGVGRLCNWTPDEQGPEADEYPSFGAYQRTLTLVCEQGNPGIVSWTPDRNTPDTVYYQCFTHRYLGWKINVVDECDDRTAQESERVERISLPDDDVSISHGDLLEGEESIQVATKVKPDNNFILDQRSKLEKHINTKHSHFNDYNDDFPKFSNRGRPHVDDTLTGEVMFKTDPGKNNINTGPNQPEYELPFTNQQLHHVLDTMDSLESKMKEEMGHHPIYQHSTPPSSHDGTGLDLQPERPVREDEELLIESARLPSSMMLPPNQKPLTLQTFMRPNGKPTHVNPVYRRPSPPEIKNRRPVNHKPMHGMPMRNPYLSNAPGPVPPFKKHLYKNGNNRLPINGYGRPMPGLPPPKNFPPVNIPKPLFNNHQQNGFNHQQKPAPHNGQPVVVGKPILPPQQTLQLGQSNIIAAHVVKSQITLPSVNDHISEQSVPQTYFNKPGQIILGKPMENPVPLDQQMTQTKVQVVRVPPSTQDNFPSTTLRIRSDYEVSTQSSDMKSSDFIGESTDNSALVQPAVNTGFKPDSIVIESGFKPIIREPLMANEDRITDYLHESANRRQDTDVSEDYEESPQPIANTYYNTEPLTQSFEPMFIPSPPDHILPVNETTKEVFPRNHAKEDRPQPVYIKSENVGTGLFSKQNLAKDTPADMVMAADRVNAHYLPPDPNDQKKPPQKVAPEVTYTSYDGKTVSAATLTGISSSDGKNKLFSSKLSSNSDHLTKKPQFGPFTGELPPIIAEQLSVKPSPGTSQNDKRVTHLKLVNTLLESRVEPQDSLEGQGSEIVENRTEVQKEEEQEEEGDSYEDEETEDAEEEEEEESERRLRRDVQSTNYEHDDHAHENNTTTNHDHSAHDHNSKEHSYSSGLRTFYHCWKTNLVFTFLLIKFI